MNRRGKVSALVSLFLLSSLVVFPQQKDKNPPKEQSKQDAEKAKSKQREVENKYLKNWLDNDVSYIIAPEEMAAYKRLTTDDERESFIENFWLRRDPTPDTVENEFRDEHYERIAYANERYSSGKPGWKTDRGRIYIIHGKPDDVEDHAAGGTYDRPYEEGGGTTSTYPFQKWTYRYIEGIGNNVELEFVDKSLSGEYRLTIDPYEKDALLNVPGAGLTRDEENNGGDKSNRVAGIDGGDPNRLGTDNNTRMRYNQFDRLDLYSKIFRPPEIKYKDLEALVDVKLSFNTLPFIMRMDFVRVTEDTVLTPITVEIPFKDLAFQEQEGLQKAQARVFARITGVNGRVVATVEDPIEKVLTPAEYKPALETNARYQKTVPLRPGLYKIELVVKDTNSGNIGVTQKGFAVPRIPENKLATSSLILADRVDTLPPRQVATGMFILGGLKVVPNVKREFLKSQSMFMWLQVYSLKVDEATHKPSATVETLITRNGKEVQKLTEDANEFSGAAQQLTLVKSIALAQFEPGEYSIQVKITDNLTKEVVAAPDKTTFKVR